MNNTITINRTRWLILGLALLAMLPMAMIAYSLSDQPTRGLVLAFLVLMAGLIAASLAFKRTIKMVTLPSSLAEYQKPCADKGGAKPTDTAADTWNYFRQLLDDLNQIQQSQSLPERYYSFIRIIENCMEKTFGPSRVSLWCPDETYENLIECVIAPLGDKTGGLSAMTGFSARRDACRTPLDSLEIRRALKTGEPTYLGHESPQDIPLGSIRCDACIPLYRKYGLPLLVCVQCLPGAVVDTRKGDRLEFKTAVELICMVWNQLQSVNQRQWDIEHEQSVGVLRDDVFLERAQALADQVRAKEELFSIVVLTLHGFRTMFAGHSRLWKDLSALVASAIRHALKDNNKSFLFGRTADDVFVLMLPQTDEFLARALMKRVIAQIDRVIPRAPLVQDSNMMALEIAWTLADQRQYQGSIPKMLDRIYRRLFNRDQQAAKETHRVILNQELQEAGI